MLKAPDIPSVLLELGFLSDPDDEKHLLSDAWRERVAGPWSRSIDGYFAKNRQKSILAKPRVPDLRPRPYGGPRAPS